VVKLLQRRAGAIDARLGARLRRCASARHRHRRDRGVRLRRACWSVTPRGGPGRRRIDVRDRAHGRLRAGAPLRATRDRERQEHRTANKALLRSTARDLRAAARRKVDVRFEASVGGGIPIVRVLRTRGRRQTLAVHGIVNGTCNYILVDR